MSKVISIRFGEEQTERLGRMARRLHRTPSQAAALLLDEALRMADYSAIVFRDSPVGRQAYVQGTGLAVWEMISLLQAHDGDVEETARYLDVPPALVRAAVQYANDFPGEIAQAIEDSDSYDLEKLRRLLPSLEVFKPIL